MNRSNLALVFVVLVFSGALALNRTSNAGAARAQLDTINPTELDLAAAADLPALAILSPISGRSEPVSITHADDGSGRIFVVEQGGRIRIIRNGIVLPTPFLDISGRISAGGERGLLGLAFAPGYASNGRFYVNYTNTRQSRSKPERSAGKNPATQC